ncbi:hypothetical protein [Brevibacillus sp. NRS-1366]
MLFRVAGLNQVDIIVTDQEPDLEMADALRKNEVEVIVATPDATIL